jgi:hypothetical protein
MATAKDEEDANRYASIMREIKLRCESINTVTKSGLSVPPPFLQEYGYLQLRMICELIGLACLIAHGDIAIGARSLSPKAYKPGEVLKALGTLHPSFFPSARSLQFKPDGIELFDGNKNAISKDEVIALWGRCGDFLHRGGIKQLASPKITDTTDFRKITEPGQKILDLLSIHLISRRDAKFHFLVALSAPQVGGDVLVSIAESPRTPGEKSIVA